MTDRLIHASIGTAADETNNLIPVKDVEFAFIAICCELAIVC